MKLFTKDIDKHLFKQYHLGSDLDNQVVVTKIFNPYGRGRWFLINSDPDDQDYIWAIVQMGDIVEVGSVSRSELESIRVSPFRLPLERDLGFRPVNAEELLRGLREGKFYKKGGWVENENKEMAENQATEVKHHSEELSNALKNTDHVEAWVVGKMERATTDLSDVTHYLDGESKKMADGGEVDGLKGKVVRYDLLGGGSGMFVVDDVMVSPPYYSKREVSLYTKEGGIDKFPYERLSDFMSGKSVEVSDSKGEPYTLTLKNRMADGGMMADGGELKDIEKDAIKLSKTYGKIYLVQRQGGGEEGKYVLTTEEDLMDELNSIYKSRFIQLYANGKKYADGGEVNKYAEVFDKLKKGDKVKITFGSGISKQNKAELLVKSKNIVGKGKSYESEKITFENTRNPQGIKFYAYKRKSGYVGFAMGDLAISDVQISFEDKKSKGGYMKKGGMSDKKIKFDDKVKAIQSSLLKRKKVSPKVQKDYGKTYDKKEALQSAKRIAGAMRKKGK